MIPCVSNMKCAKHVGNYAIPLLRKSVSIVATPKIMQAHGGLLKEVRRLGYEVSCC